MDGHTATKKTTRRLSLAIFGYTELVKPFRNIEGLGGGFRYCRLGVPLFNEFGNIDIAVTFPDLAAHVFFSETGAPIPERADATTPYLGRRGEKAVYLLVSSGRNGPAYDGAGDVLTPDALANLPAPPKGFEGARVVYGEGCTVSSDRLRVEGVVFKQIPYQIAGV